MNHLPNALRLIVFVLVTLAVSGCGRVTDYVYGEDNTAPPAELKKLEEPIAVRTAWSRDVGSGGGRGASGLIPVLHGDTVYAAERGGDVMAFDAQTGATRWSVNIDLVLTGGPGTNGKIVVLGTENGEISALDASTGSIIWETRVSSEVLAPPRLAEGVIIIRSVDGKLTALDAETGDVRWNYDRSVPVLSLRGTSAPTIEDGLVVAGFDSGRLVAVDLNDGQTVWERRVAVPRGRSELERLVDIDAEPLILDETVYVATFQGRVAALDLYSGDVVWRRDMSSHSGLGLDDDYVFVTDEKSHVWGLSRDNSASLWRQRELENRALTSPRRFADYVVVGDLEGQVHWLNVDDGRVVGRTRVGSSPLYAAPVVGDGLVYIFSSDGTLSALRAATE